MISKAKSKFIKSLQIKKYRKQEQCFVVEGGKSVSELIRSDYQVLTIAGTREFLDSQPAGFAVAAEVIEVGNEELGKLGDFQMNHTALAVARMKPNKPLTAEAGEITLLLDDIRDPGNLGTIIRAADWFGVTKIIASEGTADLYNPKVINATMGSFLRVDVYYTSLPEYLAGISLPVLGAVLDGDDIHGCSFWNGGVLVIGNESHGISAGVAPNITRRVTIPRYGKAESLNAGMATVVILDNLRRVQKKD